MYHFARFVLDSLPAPSPWTTLQPSPCMPTSPPTPSTLYTHIHPPELPCKAKLCLTHKGSNTATSALLIPVMVAVGTGMGDVLAPYGGILTLILGVTLSASLAMILPVSTPPNAIAYSTGMVDTREMRKVGVIVGVVGLILAFAMLIIVGKAGIMLS